MNRDYSRKTRKRARRGRALNVALTLVICGGIFLAVGLGIRIADGKQYEAAYSALKSAVSSSESLVALTVDDVSDSGASVTLSSSTGDRVITASESLSALKSSYEVAQKDLKANSASAGQISVKSFLSSWIDSHALERKTKAFRSETGQLRLYTRLVSRAHQRKLLADAKSALSSTILSVESLSRNTTLSDETRTSLAQAALSARRVSTGDDVNTIEATRKELDDAVNKVNDEITRNNQEILQIESAVRAIKSTADASGSYASSAVSIIRAGGLNEVWGLNQMNGACAITSEQQRSWLAAYCEATPSRVYINNALSGDTVNDSYFADAMRHEVAHHLIHRRCGTTSPASIGSGANAESVASSYAVLYLGANASTLNRAVDSRYYMNQASDDAAARIHAGQCS